MSINFDFQITKIFTPHSTSLDILPVTDLREGCGQENCNKLNRQNLTVKKLPDSKVGIFKSP